MLLTILLFSQQMLQSFFSNFFYDTICLCLYLSLSISIFLSLLIQLTTIYSLSNL